MNEQTPASTYSVFWPLLLVVLSILSMAGFRMYQLVVQQSELEILRASQDAAVTESQQIREQLQAIARGTARLAAEGNANAQRIVDELARQGITVTTGN